MALPARRAAAVRRAAAFGGGILAEWRSGHLRLTDLPGTPRLIGIAAVVVIAACCMVAILGGMGVALPGGSVAVPGGLLAEPTPVAVPLAAAVLTCLGLAVASMALVAAAVGAEQRYARLTLVVVGILGASLGAATLGAVGLLDSLAASTGATERNLGTAARVAGLGAVAAATAIIVIPPRWARRHPGGSTILAAMPFVLPLVAVLVAAGAENPVTPLGQALYPSFPPTVSGAAAIVGPIHVYSTSVAFLLVPLGLWQAVTWARASGRQIGARVGRRASRLAWLLMALVGAKLTWLALGYGGLLPAMLGGRSAAWPEVRADGVVAWAYAAVLVGLALWALLRRSRKAVISEGPAERAAGLTVALFWSAQALVVGLLILLPILQLVWREPVAPVPDDVSLTACILDWFPSGGPAAVTCLDTWLLQRVPFVQAAVLIAALVLGVTWLVRGRRTSAALFLAVLGAWALPRSLNILSELTPPELPALAAIPSIDAPGLATMDALVTLAVGAMALAWHLGRQRVAPPSILALALVVSSLLAHGDTLLPTGLGLAFFAAALAFPVIYELTLDSEGLNADRADRSIRVLRALGIRSAVMTLVAVAIAVNVTALAESSNDDLARLLFALPFSVIVVAAAMRSGPADTVHVPATAGQAVEGPDIPGGTPRSAVLRTSAAGLAGVAAVLLLSGVTGVAQPAVEGAYPSPADHLERFVAETERIGAAFVTITSDPTAGDLGAELIALAASARDRLSVDSPHACFAPAWAALGSFVLDLREMGLLIRAVDEPGEGATADDLRQLGERLPLVEERLYASGGAIGPAIQEAREACRGS